MQQLVVVSLGTCKRWWTFIRQVKDFIPLTGMVLYPNIVIEADPTHNEAKMKLAELYGIMDGPRKALDLVYQGNEPCLRYQLLNHTDDLTHAVIGSRRKNRNIKKQDCQWSDSHISIQRKSAHQVSPFRRGNSPAQLKELEEQKEKDVVCGYKHVPGP
jgi:general transcription factor 3C polypeptide 3 (transcription factor C subunit 4)